jgi:hypothetical protein
LKQKGNSYFSAATAFRTLDDLLSDLRQRLQIFTLMDLPS